MIRKEIKSKETAAKVAKELVNDLTHELDCFGDYEVKLENIGKYYNVVVTSPKWCSHMITSVCVDIIMRVVKMYEFQYINVEYAIDMVKEEKEYLPAFIIRVTYTK